MIATGFEPVTTCLEGRSSIQLSYATICRVAKLPVRRSETKEEATRPYVKNTIYKKSQLLLAFLSGWQDSNLRPPAPKAGAITGLRYTPNLIRYDLYFNISMNLRPSRFQSGRNNQASFSLCFKKKPLFF